MKLQKVCKQLDAADKRTATEREARREAERRTVELERIKGKASRYIVACRRQMRVRGIQPIPLASIADFDGDEEYDEEGEEGGGGAGGRRRKSERAVMSERAAAHELGVDLRAERREFDGESGSESDREDEEEEEEEREGNSGEKEERTRGRRSGRIRRRSSGERRRRDDDDYDRMDGRKDYILRSQAELARMERETRKLQAAAVQTQVTGIYKEK